MTAGAARAPPGLLGHDQLEFTRRKSLGPAAPTTALTAAPSDGTTVTPTALKINRDDRGITVTPQEVMFEDVRVGLLFVLTFAVQNTSGETRRITVIPPRTPVFSINYEPIGGLAPGLDIRAEVEFQLPQEDETEDLANPFQSGEVGEYTDTFMIISGKDKIDIPLLARRPVPSVFHDHVVEFGTISDEKKAYRAISLVNTGSRKGAWTIKWDRSLPIAFSPVEGILHEGRRYRDTEGSISTLAAQQQPSSESTAHIEVAFDAKRWSTNEPFRTLATVIIPGQQETVIDISATVCTQKLRLLDAASNFASELSTVNFGTLHYGCRGEMKCMLFNDGPELAPFMASVEMEGGRLGGGLGGSELTKKVQLPFEVEPRDGTIAPYGRQDIVIRFQPKLPPQLSGFNGGRCEQEPLPSTFKGKLLLEHTERRKDEVSVPLSGGGVKPTVSVTQRVVRFGTCACYERRDVVVGIKNTGELPVRFSLTKAPNFSCIPSKGLLQPMQSQNAVITFCPAQLGHFRGVLNLSLGGDALVLPIRVIGEAPTVGTKQPRPGGIDKLPADFKPKFNFVLSKSASGLRRAAMGKEAWIRPKPFEIVGLLTTNSWDSDTHTPGTVGGVDEAFGRFTFSMQELAQRDQDRRNIDAWLAVQSLTRAKIKSGKETIRRAKLQGKDWRDPERGVDLGMDRWVEKDEPAPKLPPAQDDPLFLHKPLDSQEKGDGVVDVKADMNRLIARKFKRAPATQADARDCATLIGREQLAKVELHFRTLDFGQVTVGSANARNLAVTNHLPHALLAELLGLEGQAELAGSGPPAQVIPAGATAGFDVHFKCHIEQVYRKALKLSLNRGAVHQFSLLVHTVPVSVQLDQDEISMEFPAGSLDTTLRRPLTLINEGNATAAFSWASRGAFSVSPDKGVIGPRGKLEAEVVWTPQPGCSSSETLVLKVENGQDKGLPVFGKLPEARCRFVPPSPQRGTNLSRSNDNAHANPGTANNDGNDNHINRGVSGNAISTTAIGSGGSNVLDFGHVSVGVEIERTVLLQNTGRFQAAFFVHTSDLNMVGIDVHPTRGLIEPKHSCALTVVIRATRELRLNGITLTANVRGGRQAKIFLGGYAQIPEVCLLETGFDFGSLTAGGWESLPATLVNNSPMPASLHLDLTQFPEFHLEPKKILVAAVERTSGEGEAGKDDNNGGDERVVSRIDKIERINGDSNNAASSLSTSTGGRGFLSVARHWKILVAAGDRLTFNLVYRPESPGEHTFQIPLSLEGIPPENVARLRVPVTAAALKPTLTFLSTLVDFGRCVVSRDPCALKQYQGEFVLRNASGKGLSWVIDDALLREAEPITDGEVGAGASACPVPPNPIASTGPVTPALYVSPTEGNLSPGEESRIRLTLTPKRAGVLSFSLPVWLAARIPKRGTRPYLTLRVQAFGVFPCLSFSRLPVELPVVPLSVTSRAMVYVINSGFTDMEVSYRLPQHCPVDLAVAFPEGQNLGVGVEKIPVEVSFRSWKPVSFSCVLDFFDADGGLYPLQIRGCADNCLLTNFPFVRAYRGRFDFWAKEGKSVQFMTDAQIKAQEANDFKDRQAKRTRAKTKQAHNTSNTSQTQDTSITGGQLATSVLVSEKANVDPAAATTSAKPIGGGNGNGGAADGGVDAGVDLSKGAYARGADEAGARVLCAWLNANIATTCMQEFPGSVVETHGRPALEAIETMSGRKVPGQAWRKINPNGGGRAEDRVALLMEQYRQMLRFLGEKGCLLHSVRPEELLDRADHARATSGSGGGVAELETHASIPSTGQDRDREGVQEDHWVSRSREAWTTVMYQCIRTFMLARVTPQALSALPGVFIVVPTKRGGGKGASGQVESDPELDGSNVLSVGEGVLLKWLSYHLEQANRTCVPKRVTTFSDDLKDASILCQAVASHVPYFTEKGRPLYGFIPVHSTGELSDRSNREMNALKLLTAMSKLRVDFGLTQDDILDMSDRDGVLLALHLFQALPQMVPKTEIEFRANLRTMVSKSIELKNPSSKAIIYDVTIEGSSDFRAKGTEVHLNSGGQSEFIVELLPKFSSPVEARLTFWARRNKGGMAPASSMVFALKSRVESVEPVSVTHVQAHCYEPQTIALQVSNPFEDATHNSADGRFTLRLTQAILSEHAAVAGLTAGGRRASMNMVGGTHRRRSSAQTSLVTSKDAGSAVEGGGRRAGETGGAKNKHQDGVGAGHGSDDVKAIRDAVETALKFPLHTDQQSVNIPGGSSTALNLLLLPFAPGEYKCTVMFWNERLGEFAQEVKVNVELPLPVAVLPLKITAQDGGGGASEAVQRDLVLPSKNAALQNALFGVLLDRFQSDRKTRARQAMLSVWADAIETSATQQSEEAALFAIEVDSPFFQLARETILLASETPGGGGGSGGGIGGGNMTSRSNPARGGAKNRNIPKTVELLEPNIRGSYGNGGAGDLRGLVSASAAVGAGGGSGALGESTALQATNVAVLNFFPRAAGTYPCRVLIKRRTRYIVDVRCVDIAGSVDVPRKATALVFRAPAGQKITQEIPIHNNGEVSWTLNAGPRQPPFGGPHQLIVPARGAASYPLTFSPLRASAEELSSKLVLSDLRDKSKPARFEFDLRGTAEEPLAEGHRVVRCSARERIEQSFVLRNPSGKDVEYTVDSDLPGVNGSPGLIVPAKGKAEYRLSMCPQFGGVFTGSLTFTAPGGLVTWYTVEIQASNPSEEDVVAISTVLRQAVSVEISLSNPLEQDLQFQVFLQGEGLLGDPTFSLAPLASSTYTLYYSPLRVQSHAGSITFGADAVGEFWYRLDLRADPCPPVSLNEISCPVGASRGMEVSIDNPVGKEIVLSAKTSNTRNFSVEPGQVAIAPYGATTFQVVYTPSSLGLKEIGDIILAHPELGDWVFEASGVGEMPGVMEEHRAVATVGSHTSTMFPFRNPFPESLLLTVLLKTSDEQQGQVVANRARGGTLARKEKSSKSEKGGGSGDERVQSPFVLLLKKRTDLVLQPFQSLQIPLSFSPKVIEEERVCVEVRGQLGGRSLMWVFPVTGGGEAPGGLKAFSLTCPAKSSVREDFEVELVGLAGVEAREEFAFELATSGDPALKRLLERAVSVVPVKTSLSHPKEMLKFQVSLEPLKPFRAVVEIVVTRKTGGGRWRYEVKIEATEALPDDSISLRAPVGGQSSAVFRLCNRYLGFAPFQAYFTADSALSLSIEPTSGVLTPYGTDGTAMTVTYAPTRYAPSQKGRLIVETDDIRWSYAVIGDFPGFRAPVGVASKVDSGSHAGSRSNSNLHRNGGGSQRTSNARGVGRGTTSASIPSWNGGDVAGGFGSRSDLGPLRKSGGLASPNSQSSAGGR